MGTKINKETRRYWDNFMDARDWIYTLCIPNLDHENKPEPRVVFEYTGYKEGRFWIGGFYGMEAQIDAGNWPIVYINGENPEKYAVNQIDKESEEEYKWQANAVERFRERRRIHQERKNAGAL